MFFFVAMQFKIALCQLAVTSDKDNNIAHAQEKIESAAENGAKLIVLPVFSALSLSFMQGFESEVKTLMI
mgnify:FL=1